MSSARYTSHVEWNFFFYPPRGKVYRRCWEITVNGSSEWNDAHFFLTSKPRIGLALGGPPPGFSPWAVYWWRRRIEYQNVRYREGREIVEAESTMVCFLPPTEGFGWGPTDWKYPPGRDFKFSVCSDWYDDMDSLPGAETVVFNLTKDGEPID